MLEGQRQSLRSKDSLAGHNLIVSVPPTRIVERTGIEVPTTDTPAGANRAENTVLITDIGDIRPTVSEKGTFLPRTLLYEQSAEFKNSHLHIDLTAEFRDNLGVQQIFGKLVYHKLGFGNRFFNLVAKPILEVVAQ